MWTSTNGRNTPLVGHFRSLAATTKHITGFGSIIIIIIIIIIMVIIRDWQAHLSCDRGQQGNDIPVPTPVHSSPKGECGLLPEHNEHHMKRRRNRLHCLASIFLPAALCFWANNNNKFNKAAVHAARRFLETMPKTTCLSNWTSLMHSTAYTDLTCYSP